MFYLEQFKKEQEETGMKIPIDHYASGEYLYTRMTAPVCEKNGLTHMEFTVLIFLANNPGYDTASQIVKIRRLTKSHVSVSIRSLEAKGLLVGEYREHNRRTVHLSLTLDADPIVEDGRKAQQKFYEAIFSGFTPEEREQMMEFMNRIDDNLKFHIQNGAGNHD